jgi:alcohol dehydrogenase class IV
MIQAFNFASTPQLYFGAGKITVLPSVIKPIGSRILLVHGARSFISSAAGETLIHQLTSQGFSVEQYTIGKEPTPVLIDTAVRTHASNAPDVVVAIGGGSVLDAGKAISAMILLNEPVKDYLEGVGTKPAHPGIKIPFIAVPTTSGTGSEATKNAVLSETGPGGYKRSLRHDNFVPDVTLIDPMLTISCSPSTTAASGMDAFTQLLESYLSTAANPLTDACALEGLKLVSQSLLKAYHQGSEVDARSGMALAAYLSGISLANAGLGLVHGFASSIGGYFDIPHGVICSSLMAPANKITVSKLRTEKSNEGALEKYAAVGKIFSGHENKSSEYYIDFLLALLESWTKEMKIPKLGQFGISTADYEKILSATDNKNNPAKLNHDEISDVLSSAVG